MSLQNDLQSILQFLNAGRFNDAQSVARSSLLKYPSAYKLHQFYGVALSKAGKHTEARDALRRACELEARDAECWNALGNIEKQLGDGKAAIAAYEQAIAKNGSYEPAYRNLSGLYLENNLSRKVGSLIAKWQVKFPRSAFLQEFLGDSLKKERKYADALERYEAALASNPQSLKAWYGRASCLIELGRANDTLQICDALIKNGWNNPEIHYLTGRALLQSGSASSAETYFKQAADAGSIDGATDLVNLHWMTGRSKDAEHTAREIIQSSGTTADQKRAILSQTLEMERFDLCLEMCAVITRLFPDIRVRDFEARALNWLGEYDSAFEISDTEYQRDPDNPMNAYVQVIQCFATGRYDLALDISAIWRDRNPLNQLWIALQGDAWRMLGDERHDWLCDYENLVLPLQLPLPAGFADHDDFHTRFVEQIHGQTEFKDYPLGQSLRAGIQSPRDLKYDGSQEVQAYIQALQAPIEAYVSRLGTQQAHPLMRRNSGDFFIQGIWSVLLHAGGRHVSHVHPEGWISSAYYMVVPEETDRDKDAKPGWIHFGEPPHKIYDEAPPKKWIQPKPGTLVLFPSYMWHGTNPVSGASPRITAPLDIQPGKAN